MRILRGRITDIQIDRGINTNAGYVYQHVFTINGIRLQTRLLKETRLRIGDDCYAICSPSQTNLIIEIFKATNLASIKQKYAFKARLYLFLALFCYLLSGFIFLFLKEQLAAGLILIFIGSLGVKAVFDMKSFVNLLNEKKSKLNQ